VDICIDYLVNRGVTARVQTTVDCRVNSSVTGCLECRVRTGATVNIASRRTTVIWLGWGGRHDYAPLPATNITFGVDALHRTGCGAEARTWSEETQSANRDSKTAAQ
jgi:hypothetical protein